jgi:hypothetical protein
MNRGSNPRGDASKNATPRLEIQGVALSHPEQADIAPVLPVSLMPA